MLSRTRGRVGRGSSAGSGVRIVAAAEKARGAGSAGTAECRCARTHSPCGTSLPTVMRRSSGASDPGDSQPLCEPEEGVGAADRETAVNPCYRFRGTGGLCEKGLPGIQPRSLQLWLKVKGTFSFVSSPLWHHPGHWLCDGVWRWKRLGPGRIIPFPLVTDVLSLELPLPLPPYPG